MSSCMYRTAEDSAFNNVCRDVQNRLDRGLENANFIYYTSYRRLIGWLKSYHPEVKVDYYRLAGIHVEERDNQLMAKDSNSNWHPFSAREFDAIAQYIKKHFVKPGVIINS
ncbi:hypothetical protein MOO44_05195 [Nicoliella spurrieriana]|uniref:Uncharacterized protein n=1 Tax=Nicoliella spurrieriana TaxID=2925830 RepID=A0A976RR25_9LACO|nr:hypothetical protein [Nicoliella spurrieriana]UQS86322.1 hypothetical protein MOO44_05195 [Nicoliella spurrieriana]